MAEPLPPPPILWGKDFSGILPDAFPGAQKTAVYYSKQRLPGVAGVYGAKADLSGVLPAKLEPYVDAILQWARSGTPRYAVMAPEQQIQGAFDTALNNRQSLDQTVAHEAGHAVWDQDLSVENKKKWNALHDTLRSSRRISPLHWAVMWRYPDEPGHSFADFAGYYASHPGLLQSELPDVYNYFRDLYGFEYKRKR